MSRRRWVLIVGTLAPLLAVVFAAVVKQRTSGYRVTIKRATLQRISRSMRHLVAMSNARFRIDQLHWAIPTRFVVRNTAGALLTVSRTGGSRGNSFVSSKPKLDKPTSARPTPRRSRNRSLRRRLKKKGLTLRVRPLVRWAPT